MKDYGKFTEGYCFKIDTKIPTEIFTPSPNKPEVANGVHKNIIICSDNESDKAKLMNYIIVLKLKSQHEKGIYMSDGDTPNINNLLKMDEISNQKPNSKLDGYWVILQDWSQCTLKCGGGEQIQQLMCVPPRIGGKPCEGSPIRKRQCNTNPCPTANTLKQLSALRNNKTFPPEVKMMAVSKRPQRYDKCFIKESDVLMENKDDMVKNLPGLTKIPVRLVMNDKTISAFIDDNLANRVVTFLLDETIFLRVNNDNNCFKLKTNIKESTFCQLYPSETNWLENWDSDFSLFKNKCKINNKRSYNIREEQKLENAYKKEIEEVKTDMIEEQKQLVKQKIEKEDEVRSLQQISKAKKVSIEALEKEMKLEQILEREEKAKEDAEMNSIQKLIDEEKKRQEFLNKALKEKELANQYNLTKIKIEEKVKSIQERTKKEVLKKRLAIKQKIQEMRKKEQRRKQELMIELINIRKTMADKFSRASKLGKSDYCKISAKNEERENYCNVNFSNDIIRFQECKDSSSFCYLCCENEFGDLHKIERENCYVQCEK